MTDGPKIILRYFHLKKKISSDNLDITYFKKEVRGFLKNEDMMFLNDFLDKCKEYSFSNVELEDDNDDQKLELIQFIERVDLYV